MLEFNIQIVNEQIASLSTHLETVKAELTKLQEQVGARCKNPLMLYFGTPSTLEERYAKLGEKIRRVMEHFNLEEHTQYEKTTLRKRKVKSTHVV